MTDDFLRAYKTTVDFWAEDLKMKPLAAVEDRRRIVGIIDGNDS